MDSCALFNYFPDFSLTLPRLAIVPQPTPVEALKRLGSKWKHSKLFIKREDKTDSTYGGNKVRNLEFILGEATAKGFHKLITMAPLGSNFIAALCAQARAKNFALEVAHFVPLSTPQIQAHWQFSQQSGAQFNIYPGFYGSVPAYLHSQLRRLLAKWIAPGGSSATGALGHVNAILELEEQIQAGEIPDPQNIILGVGTCGTLAGMLAAHKILGKERRIIGVRCVDRIVCNRFAIAHLANATLKKLRSEARVSPREIELLSPPIDFGYGHSSPAATEVMREFHGEEGIALDTTYTSKVILTLKKLVTEGNIGKDENTLYWHTFSGKYVVPEPQKAP